MCCHPYPMRFSLSDLLVERYLFGMRSTVPLVITNEGEAFWPPGLDIGEPCQME